MDDAILLVSTSKIWPSSSKSSFFNGAQQTWGKDISDRVTWSLWKDVYTSSTLVLDCGWTCVAYLFLETFTLSTTAPVIFLYLFIYVCECFLCVHVCLPLKCLVPQGPVEVVGSPEPELPTNGYEPPCGHWNWTRFSGKRTNTLNFWTTSPTLPLNLLSIIMFSRMADLVGESKWLGRQSFLVSAWGPLWSFCNIQIPGSCPRLLDQNSLK